ncbi:flagellar biosynthetic protein FliO [Paenibacillus septentrionalis]|uniref:Flagellar biosynthetic protein FliO n=2 Tax=Paenibacillus septentrionalis TaxID=429342 RepID=A0ABW1UZX2_9BACL
MRTLALKIASSSSLLISLPGIAVAASSNSGQASDLSIDGSPGIQTNLVFDVIKVFVALAVVIALLLVTIKWLSKRNRAWGNQRGMRSLGGISLGQSSSMQVIEVADRIYFVGVGDTVTLLDKEENPEKVSQIIASLELSEQSNMSFATLKDFLSSRKKRNDQHAAETEADGMWNEPRTFEDLLQTKLDKQAERKQELESLLKDNK